MVFDDFVETSDQTDFNDANHEVTNQADGDKLNSLTDPTDEEVDEGKLVSDAVNQNVSTFNPEMMMEQMVKNFALAKNIFGETMLRRVSGYDANYIKKNIQIPEFKKELKDKIVDKLDKLKKDGILDSSGTITDRGYDLAALVLYMEELDNIIPRGSFGEKIHKKTFVYGDKSDSRSYKKGDRYKDISLKKTVRSAIRHKHLSLTEEDLMVSDRKSRGKLSLVYALDASGSMRGRKIEICKKAGIALAYKAINEKDEVGLLVFGSDVKERILPTHNFGQLLNAITRVRASMQTNIADTIWQSIDMFPKGNVTKHLILLTDALPTFGDKPEEQTIEAVSAAKNANITLSLIGINLDDPGEKFAKKLVEVGEGRFYIVKNLEELDKIVLEDYYSLI